MRVFIILATIALAHGAKLERTYLPPSHARSSGGSGNFLQTPISGPSAHSRTSNGFSQNGAGFAQTGAGFTQTGAGFSQAGSGFSQAGAELQTGAEYSQGAFAKSNQFNNVNGFKNFEARPERPQAAIERSAGILRQDNSNDGETFAYAFETENGIYAEESGVATNGVEAQGGYSYTGDDGQVYSIRYTADQNGFMPQGDHLPTAPPVPEEILKALEQNARDEAAGIFDDGLYNEAKYSDNSFQQYQQTYSGNDDDTVVTNAAFSQNYPTNADTLKGASDGSTVATFGRASTGVQQAYLPPFASQNAGSSQTTAIRGSSVPVFRGSSGRTSESSAYSVPSVADTSRASAGSVFGARGSTDSAFATRGSTGSTFSARGSTGSGVQKAYLPPFATQGNGLRRQQSFDSKNGYRY